MDLSEIKIGDKVESYTKGWGEVTDMSDSGFTVCFDSIRSEFYSDGRYNKSDIKPEIINWEPIVKIWQPIKIYLKTENLKVLEATRRLLLYKQEFCPEYKPDWIDQFTLEKKCFIVYNENKEEYAKYKKINNPYGCGDTSENIYKILKDIL